MPYLTNDSFRAYVNDLQQLATMLEAKHNLKLVLKTGRLNGASATASFEIQSTDEASWQTSDDAKAFQHYAALWDLTKEDLGAVFFAQGKRFKLIGAKPTRPKYPFVVQDDAGKIWKGPATWNHQIVSARAAPKLAAE